MPIQPDTRPRWSTGTRSGTAALSVASMMLRPNCAPAQPIATPAIVCTCANASSESTEIAAPPSVQACRRPYARPRIRSRVRSENAPATGFAMIATSAPRPVTQPSADSLLDTPIAEICTGSRIWIGVNNAIQRPRFAANRSPIHDLRTGTTGSASAAGAPWATAIRPGIPFCFPPRVSASLPKNAKDSRTLDDGGSVGKGPDDHRIELAECRDDRTRLPRAIDPAVDHQCGGDPALRPGDRALRPAADRVELPQAAHDVRVECRQQMHGVAGRGVRQVGGQVSEAVHGTQPLTEARERRLGQPRTEIEPPRELVRGGGTVRAQVRQRQRVDRLLGRHRRPVAEPRAR